MRRRWLVWLLGVLAVLVLALAFLPWWLGPALRLGAPRYGLTFSRYERVGYSRFVLRDVAVQKEAVLVRVDRVEIDTPVLWAWRHWRGTASRVRAGNWTVDVKKSAQPPKPTPSGWVVLHRKLQQVASILDRWLPNAQVAAGEVRWPGGGLTLKAAGWDHRVLSVEGLQLRMLRAVTGTVTFPPGKDSMQASIKDAELGVALALESHGTRLDGTATWWEQPITLSAQFGAEGWLPSEAALDVPALHLPAERLKLAPAYTFIDGSTRVAWAHEKFTATISAHAAPAEKAKVPPLAVELRANGDAKSMTVETVHATVPGVVAELSAPVVIDRAHGLKESTGQFTLRADLAEQPWFKATGKVTGTARVVTGGTSPSPAVEFTVQGQSIAAQGVAVRNAEIAGQLAWPRLQIASARVVGAAGDTLTAHGGWDFRRREMLDVAVAGNLRRETVAAWLPAALQFAEVSVEAQANGPLANASQKGRVEARDVRYGKLKPLALHAEWQGKGRDVEHFAVEASTESATLRAAGSASASDVRLSELLLSENRELRLQLTQPARVSWGTRTTIEGLRLKGPEAQVTADVVWGGEGSIQLMMQGIGSRWLAHFLPAKGPDWALTSFALTGTWKNGPMHFSAAGEATTALGQGRQAGVNLALRGSDDGLVLEALHGVESGNAVVNASGRFPIRIYPGGPERVHIDEAGTLVLDAVTVSNAAFWQQLAAVTGVELKEPQITAHLKGTWKQPRGEIAFQAQRAAMDPQRFKRPLPTVEGLELEVTATPGEIRLDRVVFTVEKQAVTIGGRLPVSDGGWTELVQAPVALLQRGGELRIQVPDAEVAMFSRFLPAALAPAGRLQADIHFNRGTLNGYLRLRDAASRPLGPLGVLQQVSADVGFTDHRVELREVSAMMGGQPVKLTGHVDLPSEDWLAARRAEPRYDIALTGQNLPFVRQSGLLLRGDVDLKLVSPAQGAPRIGGKVTLRDSLFLADVRAFLPHGGGASPSRRPPYFSVDTAPLNTWGLDVDVIGARFIRVRTPVFAGIASARFHLGGTLGEPRALGNATIDEGQVLMPFATFDVKQGAVRLTEENPYEPTIFVRGTGRHYGYDLTMEVTGKATAPIISFTSSPALDSEQVLLMVMTGAAPSNEVNSSLSHRAVQIGAFFGHTIYGTLTGNDARPDRLTFESGEKISRQGKETYDIEYKLSDRWTLTGEYDEFDEYNAGFKWRVAPRKKER